MSLDRRAVLKGLAAGGVLVVGGGLVAREVLDDADPAPPPASSTVPPPPPPASMADALLAVGTRYLEAYPDEAEQEVLLDALPALQGEVPARPGQGLPVLADQAAEDHVTGDVVALDGWVLSRTECRAAALYAL